MPSPEEVIIGVMSIDRLQKCVEAADLLSTYQLIDPALAGALQYELEERQEYEAETGSR